MAKAKNQVLAGDYKGCSITNEFLTSNVIIKPSFGREPVRINKLTVEAYEVITEEKIRSGTSTIFRGAVGAAILGPVGILAGLTGKKNGINTIAIQWKIAGRSLIEIDDKLYKMLIESLF